MTTAMHRENVDRLADTAPRVLFTVDVEVGHGHDAQARLWGKCAEGEFGIAYLLNQFRAHGQHCTYFVNVYESKRHGAMLFRDVCNTVSCEGGDVQLHTHPDGWTGEQERPFMWQYSKSDQAELLRTGLGLIGDWTGKAPIAHRAGSLAADDSTLEACAAVGLSIDSSFAYGWGACHLDRAFRLRNYPYRHPSGVLELPISTFQDFPPLRHVRHVDINAATLEELTTVLRSHASDPEGILVILMHSFSFVERRDGVYHARMKEIGKFERFLSGVADSGCQTVTMSAMQADTVSAGADNAKPKPLATGIGLSYRRSVSQMHRSRKALAFVIAPWVVPLLVAAGLWAIFAAWRG